MSPTSLAGAGRGGRSGVDRVTVFPPRRLGLQVILFDVDEKPDARTLGNDDAKVTMTSQMERLVGTALMPGRFISDQVPRQPPSRARIMSR